jgi:hypothetical protein
VPGDAVSPAALRAVAPGSAARTVIATRGAPCRAGCAARRVRAAAGRAPFRIRCRRSSPSARSPR